MSRNLKYGCAVGLDLLFGHEKNVPQIPADPRWIRDMCHTLGLSPKPGAKTNRAWLRSAEPLWRRHSAESHIWYHVSLVSFHLEQDLSLHNPDTFEDYRSVIS